MKDDVSKRFPTEIRELLVGFMWLYAFSTSFPSLFSFSLIIHSSIFSLSKCLNISYRKDKKWKHEDASEMMFDYLVRDNNIPISEKDQQFVKALIAGEPSRT